MKPHYQHYCSSCIYLGTLHIPTTGTIHLAFPIEEQTDTYDFYFCPQSGLPTVIARFGDDDYLSGIYSAKDGVFPLDIALILAKKKGLVQA